MSLPLFLISPSERAFEDEVRLSEPQPGAKNGRVSTAQAATTAAAERVIFKNTRPCLMLAVYHDTGSQTATANALYNMGLCLTAQNRLCGQGGRRQDDEQTEYLAPLARRLEIL